MATPTNTKNRVIYIMLCIVALLSVPLIAMQFTSEINWTLFDFVIMGMLLSLVGVAFEVIARSAGDAKRRIIYTVLVLILFLYIWAELAVGIFNIPGVSGS